ncbi:class F sortase [Micromonospora zamorensis]|uniref:Class F sortase n=1 Tax=Micromonospora zamorensis TaxID=709883 RepID=A0ABZ1P9W5_9ACTN|nr:MULTISPECIES: class F sortase [Micromonospora]MBQ0976874.1 class F sortase [Micromonospora sp. M61]MBQ1036417.1 class F sortase [Micromonospora sp. C81]TQJ20757.1 sortase (surface protein transpeptidase) [Micromonospora sp. A202]WSK46912.1 class F sortase [Micromonospora zamorensis]WTE84420.1 class F sortase [Micromonospora zamorensis]
MTVRNRGALAALAAGVAALTVSTLVACGSQPAENVGADEASTLASTPATATSAPSVPVTVGELPADAAIVPPVRLVIPGIDVTATVNAVGINERTNEFEVPPSVDQIGWYRYGPGLETDAGSVVIAGHVDSAKQGKGAFFRLRELDQGDTLTATGSDGEARQYRVVAREEYAKTKIPLDRYFARDGKPRLTLITCGGPFDAKARKYRDNIVVTAVPA